MPASSQAARTRLTAQNRKVPEPHAGLLVSLMFGTKSALPRELYDALIVSGTIHIAALSGQNLSIPGRLVSDQLVGLMGKRIASALTLVLFVWFVLFVGPSPSIVRAAIMGSLSVLAVLLGRQYLALLSWGVAVGGMLIFNFSWLTDISFQLSALATLGIILFGKENAGPATMIDQSSSENGDQRERNQNIDRRTSIQSWIPQALTSGIKDDLRLTLAAQSLTVPLILFHFHRISLVSPLANLAIGWVIGPLTGLGWVTVVAGWAWLPLGQAFALIDWLFLEYLVRTIQFMSRVPLASVGI